MPSLTIQLPNLPSVNHMLREEVMTIGRMKGNTIALDDSSVSVSHAKITRKNGDFFLKDLNSTNGTMLNGQSINETRLRDGDQLKFGEVIAHYHAEPAFVSVTPASSPTTAPAPAPITLSALQPPPSAPVTAPPPAPVSSAMFSNPSTSFVTKSQVSQAAQSSPTPPAANPSMHGSRSSRGSRQKRSWLIPILGGAAALGAAGVLGWMFFGGNPGDPKIAPDPDPIAAPVTLPDHPAATAAPKQISTSAPAPKITVADPNENQSLSDLKKTLKAADPAERRRAAAALHSLGAGAKDVVPDLRTALNDSDPEVRMWSALALINNKSYDKATIPILVQVLHHENATLRQVACLSLALIPYEDAEKGTVVPALVGTANKDDDDEVRKTAISALKIIAPELSLGEK
jgi:predicted component of type VI protein secretion system